jgi:hypothetical protein
MDNLSYGQYLEVIEAVGPKGVILSSDVGQIFSPPVGEAMREFFDQLHAHGVSENDIIQMSVLNTNHLLFAREAQPNRSSIASLAS